ncbi:putative cyclin-dependent kinase 8 [Colletotrichum viniferum]|nr:putative cyclin-dependent kinase 8 [Colletotrichum viniferum]
MSSIPNRRIPSPTSSSQEPAAGNEREMIGPLENVNELAQSQSSLANSDPPSLADLIIKNCEETAFSGQSELYLPSGTLEILVHRESVKQELGAHFTNKSSDEIDRQATAICGGTDGSSTSYRRVFAILTLAEATHCIDEILQTSTGICDIDLPLLLVKSQGMAKADLRRKSDPDTPLTCFKNWLASGLSAIHEYTDQDDTGTTHEPIYGRHGDIKPENILLFRPSEQEHGTLAIADFGLGVFNSRRSRSNLPSKDIAFTLTYRPPESAIQDAKVSRSWDIWTLGCVYAELVTWLLGGWNLTEHFVEWRMTNSTIFGPNARTDEFFELVEVCPQRDGRVFGTGALVKQKVTRWFEGLHNHQRCTGFAHDILKLVQDKMLIVESATRKRAGSKDILVELETLVNRCSADNSYCTKPERWDLPDESMNEQPAVMVILSTDAQEVARQNRATLQKYSGPTEK